MFLPWASTAAVCQEVGLGDFVDDRDDVGDLSAALIDLAHRLDRASCNRSAFVCDVASCDGQLIGMLGVVGVLTYRGGHLFHGRGGLFECTGLFGRALREILAALVICSDRP
jgi:hypothetical protein